MGGGGEEQQGWGVGDGVRGAAAGAKVCQEGGALEGYTAYEQGGGASAGLHNA